MQRRMNQYGALLFAGVLALSGCGGDDGAKGVDGTNGQDGMSAVTGGLKLVIDGVATTADASTVTFTVYPAAAACPGGTCNDTLSNMTQKTFYAADYDPATKTFPTARFVQFNGGIKFKGIVDGGKGAQYTAVTKAGVTPSFVPEASQHAMVYGYIADAAVLPAPATGHYSFPDNVASAAKVYGTVDYTSAANVSGCEKCHGAPYSKHGYRQATVAGLPDFASCKACHTDQRVGSDQDWQKIVDDPAGYKANGVTDADKTKYAYTANIMNDTHMSHAMEFAFPQSMANCVTCHEGKLDVVLADAKFTLTTCKSCHPVTGTGGTDSKRAPALAKAAGGVVPHDFDLYTYTGDCSTCHKAGGMAPTFAQIHSGRTATIYAADGSRYSDAIKTNVGSATYDSGTHVLTVNFSVSGANAAAIVKPTVVVSLYGYNTKDFVVSGHGSAADGTRLLEFTEGATQRSDPTKSANSPRLTVTPPMTAGNASWTVTADLSLWATQITDKIVKRVEIAFLPALGINQAVAPDNAATVKVSGVDQPNPAYNPYLAIAGVTRTFDLAANALVADADAYGKKIVDTAKCNKCHDALGTTFHTPAYGSAGVAACRLCHVVGSEGGHLEMQSRSIDSYVHAIHSMQAFDVASIDPTDPVEELRHELHVEGNYPNFAGTLNCESCHDKGTYEVPDQTRSLPSVLSASGAVAGRNIQGVPSYVVGPASRACGSCHRAELINEDDAGTLAAFNQHTALNGTLVLAGTTSTAQAAALDAVTQSLMAKLGGPATSLTAPAGTQVETCTICHPNAGADHQAAFNRWADGL